ncbi:MAG: YfiR family protein [Candidatus Korobacteraceae bacterium]
MSFAVPHSGGQYRSAAQNCPWRRVARLLAGLVCVLGMALSCVRPVCAQSANEGAVKAAFVFNLTKYVEWPRSGKEFVIAVAGEGAMAETLKTMLDGKTTESRPIRVVLAPSSEAMESCDLLYISLSSQKKFGAILSKLHGSSVLTVGDSAAFARQGGMIGFLTVGDHIEMEVNLETVQAAHLRISSRLLALTTIVHPVSGAAN